ncbi:MAG TPA: hypothetical protein VNV44_08530 [Solirubrobacteraceae bacterium]|jgi:hypothetical protein|nr:hypothetical protein [Solirubrobacteraceae bacterium]
MREGYPYPHPDHSYPDRAAADNPCIAGDARQPALKDPRGRLPRLLALVADWLVPPENPSRVILGVIVTGALLAAESGVHDTYLDTFASGAIAAALYWLAHAYADVLGRRLHDRRRLTPGALWHSLAHEWAVVRGAGIPLLALLIAAAAGADRETGVTIAVWTAAVSLATLELVAAARAGGSRGELAAEAAIGVAMGLAIIALKALVH